MYRILVISNPISEREVHEVDPYQKLSRMGFNVHFAVLGKIDRNIQIKDVNIYECAGPNIFSKLLQLIKIIKQEKIEYVINSTSSAKVLMTLLLISKISPAIPIIRVSSNTLETSVLQENNKLFKFIKRLIYPLIWRMSLSNATGIIVLSRSLYELVRQYATGDILVASQGVDTSIFRPLKMKKEYDLLFVGRLSKEKNLPMLFEVFKKLKKEMPNIKLCIIGDGPEKERLKNYASDGVLFLGYVRQSELPRYYNKSKVIVLTSLSEGLPTVLMEAMACGVPAVATNVGGVAEIVKDWETGLLAESNDYNSFKEKIKFLLENESARVKMGSKALQFVRREHSIVALAEKYKKFLSFLK